MLCVVTYITVIVIEVIGNERTVLRTKKKSSKDDYVKVPFV